MTIYRQAKWKLWRFSWCLQSPEYVCSGFCQQLLLAVQIGSQNGPAGGGRQELLGGEHGLLLLVLSLLPEVQTVLAGEQPNCRWNPWLKYFTSEKPQAILISSREKSVSRRSWRAFSHRFFIT